MLPRIEALYGRKVTVVCNERAASLYSDHPSVEQIVPIDRNRILEDVEYLNSLLSELAGIEADVVLNSVYSRDLVSDLLTAACNSPVKVGFRGDLSNQTTESREKHGAIYTHLIDSKEEHLSEVLRHQEFIAGIGGDPSALPLTLHLTNSELSFADSLFREKGVDPKRTIIFGPFSNENIKNYPRWVEVLTNLNSNTDFTLLALGSSGDKKATQAILDQLPIPSFNLCGDTNLRESAALISKSRFVISVDTSIPHLAVAVGTPHLVILGGGHFGRFFPYSPLTSVICLPLPCSGCRWRCSYTESHCITGISPQSVATAVLDSLKGSQMKPRVYIEDGMNEHGKVPQLQTLNRWMTTDEVELISLNGGFSSSKIKKNLRQAR